MVRALILASLLVASSAHADLLERDLALRMHLETAAARERHRSWMLPLVLLAGGGLVALGAALPADFGGVALPLGTHALFRGTMALAFTDDPRKIPPAYLAISPLPARVQYGEQRLARLAQQHRRNRIADGVVGIVLAASAVPLRIGFARLDDPGYRFGDSYIDFVLVTLSALGATQGMLTFFDETAAEASWASYQRQTAERKPLSRTQLRASFAF
ncbi:MAG TPA: hypothetical protein VFX59_16085 [Polyangiales bacterium]|nr:hypothetical protein [Polyangiales bacterium]